MSLNYLETLLAVIGSRPPRSQVTRKLTSPFLNPSPFPPHSKFPVPKLIVRLTTTTSWYQLLLSRTIMTHMMSLMIIQFTMALTIVIFVMSLKADVCVVHDALDFCDNSVTSSFKKLLKIKYVNRWKFFFFSLIFFLVEHKSLLYIFSSAAPQRTAFSKVPSQMAAHLRTGSPL